MSQSWVAVPLDVTCAAWLDELGVIHPPAADFRGPTEADIFAALDSISSLAWRPLSGTGHLSVCVSDRLDPGRRTEVSLIAPDGGDAGSLGFRNGPRELLEAITRALAARCGPFVLVAASDGEPVVCAATQCK